MVSLKKETAFVYVGYVLRYASLIFLIPYYGRVLGPSNYGLVLAAMSLMNIVWFIINYGFSVTGSRSIASSNSNADRTVVFGKQISARLILLPVGVLFGVLGTLYSKVLSENVWFGLLAIILGVLSAFNLGWFFQGVKKFRTSMFIEALAYPLIVTFVLLTVRESDDGIFALLSLIFASTICLIIAFYLTKPYAKLSISNLADGIDEIKKSTIIFFAGLSTLVMTAGSTYLLSFFSTSTEVAFFGIAERFISVGLALLGPIAQVLMPTIISNFGSNNNENAVRLIKKGVFLEVGYGLTFLLVILALTPFGLPFVMGHEYLPSVIILQTLACIMPFVAITHSIANYILIPLHKEKFIVIATASGAILNVLVIIILINHLDGISVAFARLIGEIFTTLVLLYLLKKEKTWQFIKNLK